MIGTLASMSSRCRARRVINSSAGSTVGACTRAGSTPADKHRDHELSIGARRVFGATSPFCRNRSQAAMTCRSRPGSGKPGEPSRGVFISYLSSSVCVFPLQLTLQAVQYCHSAIPLGTYSCQERREGKDLLLMQSKVRAKTEW